MPRPENFNPEVLGPHPGFSHATATSELVFVGGQIGSDSRGRITEPGDVAAQFRRALGNVATALAAAGSRPELAVKLTYFVLDREAYRAALKEIGTAYRETFGRHFPATSLFEVKGLFDPEALIEIECIATRSAERADPDPSG